MLAFTHEGTMRLQLIFRRRAVHLGHKEDDLCPGWRPADATVGHIS